jgi:hypothetical protein
MVDTSLVMLLVYAPYLQDAINAVPCFNQLYENLIEPLSKLNKKLFRSPANQNYNDNGDGILQSWCYQDNNVSGSLLHRVNGPSQDESGFISSRTTAINRV